MTAILAGASIMVDLGAGAVSSFSGAVVVPAGTTRIFVAPLLHAASLRTISAMTYNAVALAQVAGSRGTNTANGGDSAEMWTLAAPATGSHTLAVTFSGVTRGGFAVFFVKGDTGLGAAAGNAENFVSLTGPPADSSQILFATCLEDDSNVIAAGAYQNNAVQAQLSHGAGANSLIAGCSTMRGYPARPAWFTPGVISTATGVEVLS